MGGEREGAPAEQATPPGEMVFFVLGGGGSPFPPRSQKKRLLKPRPLPIVRPKNISELGLRCPAALFKFTFIFNACALGGPQNNHTRYHPFSTRVPSPQNESGWGLDKNCPHPFSTRVLAHAPLACPSCMPPHLAMQCPTRHGAAPPCMPVLPHGPLQLAQRACNTGAITRTITGQY
jgi:hypothetical protein